MNIEEICLNCNPCANRVEVPQIDEDLNNPFSHKFKIMDDINLGDLQFKSKPDPFNVEAFEEFRNKEMFKRKKDPYDTSEDPYMVPDDFPKPPPLIDMLNGLKDKLPLTEEQKEEFEEKIPSIIEEVAGGEGGSEDYDAESVFDAILKFLPGFELILNFDLFLPIFNLVAALLLGVALFQLFYELGVAGVDIIVEITTQIVVMLLAPLLTLVFSAVAVLTLIIPIPSITLGANISINIAAILDSVNFSIFASLGIEFGLTLAPAVMAALVGAESEDGSEPPEDMMIAEGAGKIPLCPEGIKLMQEKQGALTELFEFQENKKPLPPSKMKYIEIDTETKINLIGEGSSVIRHSVRNKKITPDSKPLMKGGIREAINRSTAQEAAVLYLFDRLRLPYDTQITLSELLLLSAGFKRNTPIDAVLLGILPMNLPQTVMLNTGYIFSALGGTEPPCPILTLRN